MDIRPVTPSDTEAIRHLHARSFGMEYLPSEEYAVGLLFTDPEGCFLAWKGNQPVGYVCSHTFGSVGYLGPLGVVEEERGHGYGKRLAQAATDYLTRRCAVVGLATWPNEGGNIGLYHKLGYRSTLPCREVFKKETTRPEADGSLPSSIVLGTTIPPERFASIVESVSSWCDALYPGLMLSRDVRLFLERWPEHIVFDIAGNEVQGFVAWKVNFLGEPWCAVRPHPEDAQTLRRLVLGAERLLPHFGHFQFHTQNERLTDLFLGWGYRIGSDLTCMLYRGHEGLYRGTMSSLFIRPWWS